MEKAFEPGSEIGLETVKERSIKGIVALTTRTFFLQAVNLVGIFLLTIYLSPSVFGVFYVVTAIVSFFTYFSDIGLAAALIQKKESLTDKDLKTTFTVQQILIITVVLIVILSSSSIAKFYNLDRDSLFLLKALAFSLFLTSLKTIPSVLLERKLEFQKLVIPQVAEAVVFNIVAVFLAIKGRGVESFTYAVLARSFVGLILIYLISPWKIGFSFSKEALGKLLSFGLPYQLNSFMALVKDDLMTIFLGKVIGPSGLGYVGWSKKWAEAPLRFFMDNVIKITFPAFSRLQETPEKLKKAVEMSLFAISSLVFPSVIGLSLLAPSLVAVIPKYQKWEPALLSLYFFGISSLWAALSTPLTNLLNAVGKIKTTFKLMVMWTALTWGFTPLLTLKLGYFGVALSQSLIGFSGIIVLIIVKKIIDIDIISSLKGAVISTIIMSVLTIILIKLLPQSLIATLFILFIAAIVYFFVLSWVEREKFNFAINSFKKILTKNA